MDWINEKAKTLRQGAIRAMFDKASTMDNVISMGIGEPDMATPELVCRAGNEALERASRTIRRTPARRLCAAPSRRSRT